MAPKRKVMIVARPRNPLLSETVSFFLGYWQLSVGISIMVVFVAIPLSYSFARSKREKSRKLQFDVVGYDDAIQRMVYENRLLLRRKNAEK